MNLVPAIGEPLQPGHISFLNAVAKSCRRTIIEMVKQSQSGHPGGSLSSIDYLALIYSYILSRTGERIVVSNGHISPAVYSVLAEMGYIPREEVIRTFRQLGSVYEGHVTRHVRGVFYGTGPLGIGVSVGAAFALAEKRKETDKKVFALMGDGEAQEGQVHEMILFASKYKLDNLILFVDYNEVQLTASLEEIMPMNLPALFKASDWNVLTVDGHDFAAMWDTLGKAYANKGKPTVIIGKTIMGKGVDFMEHEGAEKRATWHGNAPKPDQADEALKALELFPEEQAEIAKLKKMVVWQPDNPSFTESLTPTEVNTGTPILYTTETLTDSRTAYGQALLDLAKNNENIVALSADLRGSVMTKFMAAEYEHRHFEAGIAEQNMVSMAGGLSLMECIPFASTFGAFMSSRAKDQARVNDINRTNVKMVATHCGLSVGEDGPTHQAIDDMTSFLGMFNTMVIEPADPNQCDRIIRYIASHYGNFYVRMGRHKYPVITKEDGSPFFGSDYRYEYGKSDVIREGKDLTIVASGAMVHEALKAVEELKTSHPDIAIGLVAVSSIKKFDDTVTDAVRKTGKVLTVEDHNTTSGLASQFISHLVEQKIYPTLYENLGVREYQLSGKAEDLYAHAGLASHNIADTCLKILNK